MAKNRKNLSAGVRFGPVLKVVLLGGLFCVAGVGYVWQKSEIARLSQQIREREKRLVQLKDDNKRLADQISILHSPPRLDLRAKELNLGLSPALPLQVVRLVEPTGQWSRLPALPRSGSRP
jgi:hypothetical protein